MRNNLRSRKPSTVNSRQSTVCWEWPFSIINYQLSIMMLVLLLVACKRKDHANNEDTYTCPMHPTVVSDRPATCPVCGMDLVRKARPGDEVEITDDLAKLIKSPNEIVITNIKTIKSEFRSVPFLIEAQGVVTYDTRNIYTIPSRVTGRIEKIYLQYAFQPVKKGEKVADVYSPELVAAQRELLFLIQNDSENKTFIDGSKNKLELLGLSNSQIKTLLAKKETSNTFSIYSPYSGYVITDQPAPSASSSVRSTSGSASGGMANGMGTTANAGSTPVSSTTENSDGSLLREGNYVSAGQTLFRIVNTNALRIEINLPSQKAGTVNKGDKLQLDFGNGNIEAATVDFIQPFFTKGQDFLKVRVYTKTIKDLHIGHLVNARITLPASESLWVPKEAVLDLGSDKIVFIKDRGVLKPKKVTTGIISEGRIQIISGLASSDEIAANAQYLVDSESFIKTIK
jgi:Cu(I)/Ag(I) efflux system membrane fusion protein